MILYINYTPHRPAMPNVTDPCKKL